MIDPKKINDNDQYSGKDVNQLLRDVETKHRKDLQAVQETAKKSLETTTEGSVFSVSKTLTGYMDAITDGISGIGSALETLDQKGTEIMNTFGTTRSRLSEFKALYAEALPSLTTMGIGKDPATIISEIGNSLGGAVSLGTEAIVELGATGKVTGQSIETLSQNFRDVGVSVYDVADSMKEVVDYTRSVGGNVQDVSSKVVGSLEKLNMYNFSNGVAGLTKMAAQASRLGVDMNTVFTTSEKLLNPENAIEMAAGLQRLGVANSEMLDPLRLMDMGLNGPDELMKSMADMSKEFVQLNEKGQFEIMPGAKRRMREVAQELGMSGEEFSKLALKSADFDRKMKEIKMPSFVGTEEDKQMIASMAQMKGGKAVIQVKDEKTGQLTEKKVENLTPEDIENLKLSEEERGKTMEEIAIDQLDNLKVIAAAQSGITQRVSMAGAAAAPVQRAYDYVAGIQRQVPKAITSTKGGIGDYSSLIKDFSDLTTPLENMAKLFGEGKFDQGAKEMENAFNVLANIEPKFTNSFTNIVNNVMDGEKKLRQQIYGTPNTTPNQTTPNTTPNQTTPNTQQVIPTQQTLTVQTITATEITQATLSTKSDINVNLKLTAENLPPNLDQGMIKSKIEEYFSDYSNVQKLFDTDTSGGLKFKKSK